MKEAAVAAGCLGGIKCGVRPFDEFGGGFALQRLGGSTTDGDAGGPFFQAEFGRFHRAANPLHAIRHMGHFAGRQEQHELLAAVAGDQVGVPHRLAQDAGQLREHRVPRGMAVRIVQQLEAVDVDQHEEKAGAVAAKLGAPALKLVLEGPAVGQPREGIGAGLAHRRRHLLGLLGEGRFRLGNPLLEQLIGLRHLNEQLQGGIIPSRRILLEVADAPLGQVHDLAVLRHVLRHAVGHIPKLRDDLQHVVAGESRGTSFRQPAAEQEAQHDAPAKEQAPQGRPRTEFCDVAKHPRSHAAPFAAKLPPGIVGYGQGAGGAGCKEKG